MAWENSDDFSESGVDCGPDLRKTVCRIRSDPKGEIRRCLRAVVLDRWIERQCLRIQVNLESWLWLANFGVLDCSIEFLRRRGEGGERGFSEGDGKCSKCSSHAIRILFYFSTSRVTSFQNTQVIPHFYRVTIEITQLSCN